MGLRAPSSSEMDMEPGINPGRAPRHLCPPPHEPWFPWLVPLFFMVNMGAFVYTMYVNDCPTATGVGRCVFPFLGRFSFQPLYQNPLLGPSITTLELVGGLEPKLVVNEGQGWRFMSCIWLHAGVIHLLANMLSLLFIGIRLEQEFGFLRIGFLYLLSGFGGSLLSALNLHSAISVGASGALFGLLGAMLSELITNWTIYANKCAALLTLLVIIALNLAVSILPHVDSSAHIGGFLSGFLLGFMLLIRPQFGWVSHKHIPPGYEMKLVKPKHKCYQYLLWITSSVILIIGAGVSSIWVWLKGKETKTKPRSFYGFVYLEGAALIIRQLAINLPNRGLSQLIQIVVGEMLG
ncbi:hypothetical protein HHK36_013948 [Tetracentron sinense]|uniref:RHOMBOID-like protein n=1 Tax=Tetracentron sinense TaxID=13715 RepID=A0A834Z482_TETSI|nr:hypothetical protein HHK36_013948 [Tetracentron sinense]